MPKDISLPSAIQLNFYPDVDCCIAFLKVKIIIKSIPIMDFRSDSRGFCYAQPVENYLVTYSAYS